MSAHLIKGSKMNVKIEKFKTRFTIKCKYNEDKNTKKDIGIKKS